MNPASDAPTGAGSTDFAAVPLGEFLAACAAKTPVPGGGAGSAVIGAIGAAFGAMAARYSEGRAASAAESGAIGTAITRLDIARTALLDLAARDATAYGGFDRARRLPKSTAAEVAVRTHALARAAHEAAQVPLTAMRVCAEALEAVALVAEQLNPRLASDTGICALALKAALRGLMLNVEINLPALDPGVADPLRRDALAVLDRGEWAARTTMFAAKQALRGGSAS